MGKEVITGKIEASWVEKQPPEASLYQNRWLENGPQGEIVFCWGTLFVLYFAEKSREKYRCRADES